MRSLACLFSLALICILATPSRGDDPPVTTVTVERTIQGKGVDWWSRHAVQARRDANKRAATIHRLRGVLRASPTVQEAIGLAATVYGHGAELWRKAWCESRLSSRAYNSASGAAGLFEFLASTWNSTPFGRFSVWNPYANALAAGWMHHVGRGSEWACR